MTPMNTKTFLLQVRITYEERYPGDWGGFKPKVVVEYDERNNFLMAIEITYNRREANKNFAYNYRELKDKIQQELDTAQVVPWNTEKSTLASVPNAPSSVAIILNVCVAKLVGSPLPSGLSRTPSPPHPPLYPKVNEFVLRDYDKIHACPNFATSHPVSPGPAPHRRAHVPRDY